jgi:hypothetical protein
MRLCEEHRLGGIRDISADECVGCAYDALRESLEAMDGSRSSMVSTRDLTIRDLRAELKAERAYSNRLYSRLCGYEDPPHRGAEDSKT